MGVKSSSMHHSNLEPLYSTNLFDRVPEEDSLQLAFSLPCAPSHATEPEAMVINKSVFNSQNPSPSKITKPFFFFNASNGSHIVLPLFNTLNWQRTTDKLHTNCVMRWTETVLQLNYQTFKEGEQMINHIPNCGYFTNKLGLLLSLRAYEQKVKSYNKLGLWYTMKNFVPDTYWIDDASEKAEFNSIQKDGQIWIYKPCGLNQGKGIQLIRSRKEFRTLEEERAEDIRKNPNLARPRIIQNYLSQPLLLDNRKFDIRVYMGIASTMPFLVLFHFGYVRVSTRKYEIDDIDLVTHLTNQFIQKKDPNYQKVKEDTVWTMDRFNDYVNSEYLESKKIPKDWVKNELMNDMEKVAAHCFHAVREKLACRIGFFEIYGMDFMIDDQMKTWLIEINSNPAMNTNCQALKNIIPPIISSFIEISIECFEKARRWKPLLPLRGVSPLSDCSQDSSYSRRSWCIYLKPIKEDLSTSLEMPGLFTIIYNESLEMAKIRQPLTYDIPLRLWYPPKNPSPQGSYEPIKQESEKIVNSVYLLDKPSPSTTKSPVPSSNVLHSSSTPNTQISKIAKPKSPGLLNLRKATRGPPRISGASLKKTTSGSLRPIISSNSRSHNINCSVTTLQCYEKDKNPVPFTVDPPPIPPIVLADSPSSVSVAYPTISIVPEEPIVISHGNNSGTEKKHGKSYSSMHLAPLAKLEVFDPLLSLDRKRGATCS